MNTDQPQKHRWLAKGEIIQAGDEYRDIGVMSLPGNELTSFGFEPVKTYWVGLGVVVDQYIRRLLTALGYGEDGK